MRKSRYFGLLASLAIACGPHQALAQETRSEFWPELDVFVKLNKKSRLFFMYSATKLDSRETYADGSLGAHIDYYGVHTLRPRLIHPKDESRDKLIMFRSGYLYTRTPSPGSSPTVEHTPTGEGNARTPLPWGVLLTDRNRFDLRFVNGTFTPRYRNRLKLERSFHQGERFGITPYAHAEVFYDWRYDTFHRFRYAAGMEWSLGRFLVLEGYVLRQRDTKSSPTYVNAGALAIQFYFP